MAFNQFKILLWKNCILKQRHWKTSVCELLFPLIVITILSVIKATIEEEAIPYNNGLGTFQVLNVTAPFSNNMDCYLPGNFSKHAPVKPNFVIAGPPDVAESFRDFLLEYTDLASEERKSPLLKVMRSMEEFEEMVTIEGYPTFDGESTNRACGGIFFDEDVYDYTLRFNVSMESFCGVSNTRRQTNSFYGLSSDKNMWYTCTGFSQMEIIADSFLMLHKDPSLGVPDTPLGLSYSLISMPVPEYEPSTFMMVAGKLLPIMLFMCFSFALNRLVTLFILERESKIREVLEIMGMKRREYYASWIAVYMLQFTLMGFLAASLIVYGELFTYSSVWLIWLFMTLFGACSTVFILTVATPFDSPKAGAVFAFVVFFGMQFLASTVRDSWSLAERNLISLIPQVAFSQGIKVMTELEMQRAGFTLDTLHTLVDGYSMASCLSMLVVDFVVYLCLFVYFDQVLPHSVGSREHFLFFVTPSYWWPRRFKRAKGGKYHDYEFVPQSEDAIEACCAADLRAIKDSKCVDIRNLRKTFRSAEVGEVVAVNSLTTQIFTNEIYALLGHNGAGKTTTMSILTGMLSPDSSPSTRASVFGYDVSRGEIGSVRKDLGLGICPQHDILWSDLTVREHLKMIGRMKNMQDDEIAKQSQSLIGEVGLVDKMDAMTQNLSGGMKRKLSVCMAFMGDSRFVILDEPTSGMDPYARRAMWDLLRRKRREDRVIILSTHYMDEAEVLGDRIAIMRRGQLEAQGSSIFLKNAFGCGYNLTVVKKDSTDESATPKIVELVKWHLMQLGDDNVVAFMKVASDIGSELIMQLPFAASSVFERLLKDLEEQKDVLGVQTYGVSATKLEEVFMKIATGDVSASGDSKGEKRSMYRSKSFKTGDKILLNRKSIWYKQLVAMLIKRTQYALRDPRSILFLFVLPLVLVLIGLSVLKIASSLLTQPRMDLVPSMFNQDIKQDRVVLPFAGTNSSSFDGFVATMFGGAEGDIVDVSQDMFAVESRRLDSETCINALKSSSCGFLFDSGTTCRSQLFNCVQHDVLEYWAVSQICGGATFLMLNFQRVLSSFCFNDATGLAECTLKLANNNISFPEERCINLLAMADRLTESSSVYAASRYGSVLLDNFDTGEDARPGFVTIGLNTTGQHSAGVYITAFNNIFAKTRIPDFRSSVANEPFSLTHHESFTFKQISSFLPATYMLIAFSFIPAAVIQFIVRERQIGVKHQQFVSGVSYSVYWIGNFIIDCILYIPVVILTFLLFLAFNITGYVGPHSWSAFLILLVCYGPCAISFTYLCSFAFSQYVTAQNGILSLNIFTGLILGLVSYVLRLIHTGTQSFDSVLRNIFRFFPSYCLCDAVIQIPNTEIPGFDIFNYSVWSMDVALLDVIYLIALAPTYLFLTVILDMILTYPVMQKMMRCWNSEVETETKAKLGSIPSLNEESFTDFEGETVDELVGKEKLRVAKMQLPEDAEVITVYENHKIFDNVSPPKAAVKGVSFSCREGEVFGLLGVNGAGKTSLMKMCVGEHAPTYGTVIVGGYDVSTELFQARQKIGYCPQFDALLEPLTVTEHLYLYARIKGVKRSLMKSVVEEQIFRMDLDKFRNNKAETLSGGNKRKLSVAMAMIGDPEIIFLDEPSCGMDPVARRFMWGVIQDIATKCKKSAVVVTTHSMEEAEALSSRISIMADGKFKCLGSMQEIKNNHGKGFELFVKSVPPSTEQIENLVVDTWKWDPSALVQLSQIKEVCAASDERWTEMMRTIGASVIHGISALHFAEWWVAEENRSALNAWVDETFPGSRLVEGVGSAHRYLLREDAGSLPDLFALIEKGKKHICIQEYSLSQFSLEQIFNRIAKEDGEKQGNYGEGCGNYISEPAGE